MSSKQPAVEDKNAKGASWTAFLMSKPLYLRGEAACNHSEVLAETEKLEMELIILLEDLIKNLELGTAKQKGTMEEVHQPWDSICYLKVGESPPYFPFILREWCKSKMASWAWIKGALSFSIRRSLTFSTIDSSTLLLRGRTYNRVTFL